MPISTSASFNSFNDAQIIAQEAIFALRANRVLATLLKSDSQFTQDLGAYARGKTVNIPVIPTFTTQIASSAGGAVSFQTPAATSISLTLDTIAYTPFASNDVDAALANRAFRENYITQMARDHGTTIERQMFIDTFNTATIDANSLGANTVDCNYKMLRYLWKGFKDQNVPDTLQKVVILPTMQYMQLLADNTVSRLVLPDKSTTLADGIIIATLNMTILPATTLPTNLQLTNITGTDTNQVGFAFTSDSIVMATRELPTVGNGAGVEQVVVRNDDVNLATRLTRSYDSGVIGGSSRYNLETLYGTKIYRPSTVFPILGGVA